MHQHSKSQFILSIHSWDTVNFSVPWPDKSHPFSDHAHLNIFWSTFNLSKFISTYKKSGYSNDLFWRYGSLKNNATWLAENISVHIRAYSRPLLGATIAPNLVPWVLRKIFSLEMGKNDIYLGGASKQNTLSSENLP